MPPAYHGTASLTEQIHSLERAMIRRLLAVYFGMAALSIATSAIVRAFL